MPLLTDPQRALLTAIEDGQGNLQAEDQKLTNLVREVRRRDVDDTALNSPSETAADLIARATTAYRARRLAIIASANNLPQI